MKELLLRPYRGGCSNAGWFSGRCQSLNPTCMNCRDKGAGCRMGIDTSQTQNIVIMALRRSALRLLSLRQSACAAVVGCLACGRSHCAVYRRYACFCMIIFDKHVTDFVTCPGPCGVPPSSLIHSTVLIPFFFVFADCPIAGLCCTCKQPGSAEITSSRSSL